MFSRTYGLIALILVMRIPTVFINFWVYCTDCVDEDSKCFMNLWAYCTYFSDEDFKCFHEFKCFH